MKPHCLVVFTTTAEALPQLEWWHDQPAPILFGYTCRYFNPNHPLQCPTTLKDEQLGFYPIMETEGTEFTCEISREKITLILVLEMEPGQALEIYKNGDLQALKTKAIITRQPNQHAWSLIKQVAA